MRTDLSPQSVDNWSILNDQKLVFFGPVLSLEIEECQRDFFGPKIPNQLGWSTV
jgi:hypothetical protein